MAQDGAHGVNLCIDPPPPEVPNYRQSDLPPTGHHFTSNRAQPASLRSLMVPIDNQWWPASITV
jgi:hypothetical protein